MVLIDCFKCSVYVELLMLMGIQELLPVVLAATPDAASWHRVIGAPSLQLCKDRFFTCSYRVMVRASTFSLVISFALRKHFS